MSVFVATDARCSDFLLYSVVSACAVITNINVSTCKKRRILIRGILETKRNGGARKKNGKEVDYTAEQYLPV